MLTLLTLAGWCVAIAVGLVLAALIAGAWWDREFRAAFDGDEERGQ